MEHMYTISEICDQYQITTRTLRFYEEKGLIQSIQEKARMPRKYSKEEAKKIGNVIFLKNLGFSISEICELYYDKQDIKEVVESRKLLIQTQIELKKLQIKRLQDMMLLLNEGNDIFSSKVAIDEGKNTLKEKALSFSKCFLERKWDKLHQHFQPAVCKVFTIDLLKNFRETVEEQFGNFKSILHIDQFENDVSLYIEFDKCTAVMKVIFSAFHITGFTVNSIDTDMINNFLTDANNIDQSESGSNFIIRI
ncbi:MerR family transcriptional regulator [Clostridium sp. C8-1-8]|uniref:helix-turn-helix domain-containing protein n=1 Tax=Clostridium sp. C8-1-8 TaxID=2698831 RepID=UPI00136A88AC|nr:MerR family transcriptional regulator [Clostridium sp. C8-1-8]